MRVLFASTKGAGHLGPLLPLARACADAGHDVLVTGPDNLEGTVRDAGLAFRAAPEPPEDELRAFWDRAPELERDDATRATVSQVFGRMNTTARLEPHRETCRAWGPDVVVRESSEYAAGLAAELEGIPHARVGVGLAFGEDLGLDLAGPELDRLRTALAVPPDPDATALRAAPYLTWFPRTLEAPQCPQPVRASATLRLRDPGWATDAAPLPAAWWADADTASPLVYVTFGSVAGSFAETTAIYAMAMEAVADLAVRVLLTVGNAVDLERLPTAPPNVHVERWVPQGAALPHAAAVICHGGSGSTIGALAAGCPLVVVPLFADQPFNAERVAATGTGLAVAPEAAAVRAALERVLGEPGFARRAGVLAAELASHRPAADGVAALERLAATSARAA